ncbi:MAG: LssY C-terminal domain-containing protein [Terriglobia bacterium]
MAFKLCGYWAANGQHAAEFLKSETPRYRLRRAAVALCVASFCALAFAAAASSPRSSASLPTGTILYLRLKTAVSTTSSRLNAPIEAEAVRDTDVNGAVAVPLGAMVRGKVAKLIPSSSPKDRAVMGLEFDTIQMPGLSPARISCRLSKVENARETVLANGTIQGVLASELPSSYLQGELAKISKSSSSIGSEIGKLGDKQLGQTDTSITYPVGTDMQVTLTAPLAVSRLFSPAVAQTLPRGDLQAVQRLLASSPNRVRTKDGKPGDPINLVMIGTEAEIRQAFAKAGWTIPKIKNSSSIWRTITAVTGNVGYDAAPLSDLYLFGRAQDMAYEKNLNTFTMRHHLRLWRSPVTTPGGTPIWLGAGTHDIGFDIRPGVASHATSPHLDNERAKVGADMIVSGMVSAEQLVTRPNPLSSGFTGTGGKWTTDGRLIAIDFKRD